MQIKKVIDEIDFERILNLHLEYKWLNYQKTALLELWNLTNSADEKELIEFLIKKFQHVNGDMVDRACSQFVSHIENKWNLSSENTIITAICDNANPDGSQHLIQCMKNKFSHSKGWKEENFSNSIAVTAMELVKKDMNIVLVDDFVGTGYTLFRKYNWLLNKVDEQLEEKGTTHIKTISLACMEFAKKNIDQVSPDHYSYLWLKKGISELADEQDKERFTNAMYKLEAKLKPKINRWKLPNFGFKESESLYALENNNIPNNVFPIFWWPQTIDDEYRNTIFRRIL